MSNESRFNYNPADTKLHNLEYLQLKSLRIRFIEFLQPFIYVKFSLKLNKLS